MMKCDMCYDRTSAGKKPMCATVCPSQALFYGTREQIELLRPRSTPINQFRFGQQIISTKVNMMTPKVAHAEYVDVTAAMSERPSARKSLSRSYLPLTTSDPMMDALYHEEVTA
ncbi:MAG: 4Fe-4S dicluster domain-containing protein [Blastocatellia bacterium]